MKRMQSLGRAIACAMLALLVAVQISPATALAQQDGDQVALSTQASKKTVKGNGWKLTLPKYWRGKVKASKHSYGTGFDIVSKKGKSKGLTLVSISEVDVSVANTCSSTTGKTVKLKNGKKAKVVSLQTKSYFSRGAKGFFVQTKTGKYLMVSAYVPWTSSPGINGSAKCLPSKAKLKHFAKLQTLGKTSKYGDNTQIACLKAVAKRLSY